MGSFPGAKAHRVSRRRLGKGQQSAVAPVTVAATVAAVTVHLLFSVPVVVRGLIPFVTSVGTVLSQVVIDSMHVDVTCSESQAAATWSIAAGAGGMVSGVHGGVLAAAGGTF